MAESSRSSAATSTQESVTPAWVRWVVPSVADLLFVAILGVLVFTPLSVKLLGDAGIGWHIRTGQLILSTHAIPRVDPFSSQIRLPWFAWEWLYDIAVGKLETCCGLNGVVWLTAVGISAVFGWLFRLLIARGTNLFAALVLVLLAISASTIHFLARPHVLSWLFALGWFWILDSTERRTLEDRAGLGIRWLWFLPVLLLVWVNVHGGFLLGFMLLGVFWLSSLWTRWRLKESRLEESLQKIAAGKRTWNLTLVGLASMAASLVNPYGWKLHAHIYSYLTNRFLMDHIDEFQSPNFHGLAQKCFLILLMAALAILIVRGRQLRLSGGLLVLFAVYAGLYSARNVPVSSILLVMIVGPLLPSLESSFAQRMSRTDSSLCGHLWPIIATVAVLIVAAKGGRFGSRQLMDAHFDPQHMPVDAVDFLQRTNVHGPILSPDYWGGYLIYRLYPHNSVVVDDRHDFYSQEFLYGGEFLRSYLTMMHLEPGWDKFLERSSCLLLPRNAALAAILGKTPEWKSPYSDDVAIVFIPTTEREDSDRAPNR